MDELLKKMIDNFEFEMEADGYGIERVEGEEGHFLLEDYELMGWDYVHGAKRFIEYFFCYCDENGKSEYPFDVEAEFKDAGTREVHLLTGEIVQAPLLDLKFVVRK